ncbi:MAG: RdgB/HAM1 family non-canonical purine NTP pyrophosphatase [Phycisphaerae bacterium]
MATVLLATRNAGKVRELRALTADSGIEWIGLDAYPHVPEAREDGATFAENAARKALQYAAATDLPTLADDSGLEVDALGGAPGVDSAHYAGHPRDDDANNRKLVAALRGVAPAVRTARFRCAMAFAQRGAVLLEATGALEGLILDAPRGANGFGYDPHFLLPARGLTLAELSSEQKNAISHRGQALRAILPRIRAFLAGAR